MKRLYNLRNLLLIIACACVCFILYSLLGKEINKFLTYGAILLFGVCITLILNSIFQDSIMKRTNWLENRLKLWNSISYKVKIAGEKSFSDMPLGIIVFNDKKRIEWANDYAKSIFLSELVEREIVNMNKELYNKILLYDDFDIDLYGRIFSCTLLRNDNILFLSDKTDLKSLERKYDERTLAIGIINLDNLDQALNVLDAQEKTLHISNIMGIIANWCDSHQIYLRGYSEEQYLIIMDKVQAIELTNEKFKVLDDIREYCLKENLRISASIGVACEDCPILNLTSLAEEQLMLALNRGGNQVVVYIDGSITYYGGKTSSIENRSPIYVRVKTEDLVDLVKESSNVYVMSHESTDADAFGASIAMTKLVRTLDKECHIVFDEKKADQTVTIVYDEICREHMNLVDMFVSPREALSNIDENTLLIVLDCQYEQMLIDERVYHKIKRVAVIDHHRRNNSAINEYLFLYNQTSSSSTVELVVEMYEFLENEVELTPMEASLMLLGIIVDTSNLMYRTSYRTYNIMGKLQMKGAENAKVQRFLRENFDKYVERMTILGNMEIVDGQYGIAVCPEEDIHQRSFLAKIADNVITINTIKAAFCIGKIGEDEIGISARSLDEENVQTIMEKLGGGGHFNNAACQIPNISLNDAKEKLIEVLKNMDNGEDKNMKIILVSDVKGKGKKGDIIDIPAGHANYLIKGKQAILATSDNIKLLEAQNEKDKEEAEKHLQEMRKLKEVVEASPISIAVRVGKEGKLFGTVSTKQIIEEYKNQYNISLDKRKILSEKEIDALGTYKIPIQLHKDVKAVITLNVVEKEN